MRRAFLASMACVLGLAMDGRADEVKRIPTVPYGEAKPAGHRSAAPVVVAPGQTAIVADPGCAGGSTFGERLQARLLGHECAPDGCPKPIGCGNFWTEKKFIMGSCRQFFGTAGASTGFHRNSKAP